MVENACHAMLDDSYQLKDANRSQLKIKTQKNDGRIEILISDTGSGISKEIEDKVFEPLFSTKSFGVGLGMPVVKQIIEQHHGGIAIDSDPGKGTVITLWLPENIAEYDSQAVSV